MLRAYVVFHAAVDGNTSQNLIATCTQLVGQGFDEIYLLLSTPGGHVMSGLTIYNMLRALPCRVITHNVGNIDSIGNAIFLAGAERYACPHSTFMFHGVGIGMANVTLEEKNTREALDGILADQKRIGDILQQHTNLTADEASKLFTEARTKDADAALAAGIISEIKDAAIPQGAPIFSLVLGS